MEVSCIGGHVSVKEDGTLLLFNAIDSGLYTIEPITEKLLILIKNHGIEAAKMLVEEDFSIVEEKIAELKENKFLDSQPEFTPPETAPITTVSLNVSHECNLNCRYCYGSKTYVGKKQFMSREIGELSIDRLFEWSDDSKMVYVTFFGGEPLLNVGLVKHLIQYGKEKARSQGKDILFSMTCNGTLLTDEIVGFLNENGVSVLVSMDGPKNVQDQNRPFKNGTGSYDTVASNVQKLIATRNSVTARATLTRDCMSLNTLVQGLREVGFTNVHVEPAAVDGSCPFALSEKEFETLKEEYNLLGELFLDSVLNDSSFGFSNILRTTSALYKSAVRHYPCGAGRTLVGIDSTGDIYLCHRFTGMEEFSMGTVHDPDFSLQKKILLTHVDAREGCKECWARHLCGGSCWHESYSHHGCIDEPYNLKCGLFKHVAALSMIIFSKMHEKDRKLLDKMFRRNEPSYKREDLPEKTQP